MKANEAPEKIYLQKYDTDTLLCLNKYNIHEEWTERPVCGNSATGNDIEYTRTDAFIQAVADWMSDTLQTVSEVKTPSAHHVESIPALGIITQTEFIEKFKKEIKFLID